MFDRHGRRRSVEAFGHRRRSKPRRHQNERRRWGLVAGSLERNDGVIDVSMRGRGVGDLISREQLGVGCNEIRRMGISCPRGD